MKKSIALITILLVLVTALCACYIVDNRDNEPNLNDSNIADSNNNKNEIQQTVLSFSDFSGTTYRLSSADNKTDYEFLNSYYDDEFYYYIVKIGELEDVVVDTNPITLAFKGGGGATFTDTYTKSKVTSTSIEQQSTWTSERLEYDNRLAGVSWGAKVEVEIFVRGAAELNGSVQYYQNTTTTTNSNGQIVKNEEVLSEQETITIVLDSTCQPGYYRIVHTMDYDICTIAAKNIATGEICYELYTLPRKGITQVYEYSETDFEEPNLDRMEFDTSYINTLPKPNTPIENLTNDDQNEPTVDVGNTVNYAGGHGTSSSPYKISTKQHFINMVKEETTAGKYYILTNDIDLGDWSQYGITDWTKNVIEPAEPFCGNLDGNNKTVTYKVRIAKTSLRTWALGLFPAIKNATIKNLKVNADLSTENLYNAGKDYDISIADRAMDALVGGLTGYAYLSNISNCSVSGRVNWNSISGEETTCVAGVVGLSRNSNVRNCSNSATIYARGRYLAYSGVIACWYTSDNTKSYGGLSNTGALSYKLREVIETERELYHKNDLVGREGAKILTK